MIANHGSQFQMQRKQLVFKLVIVSHKKDKSMFQDLVVLLFVRNAQHVKFLTQNLTHASPIQALHASQHQR